MPNKVTGKGRVNKVTHDSNQSSLKLGTIQDQ